MMEKSQVTSIIGQAQAKIHGLKAAQLYYTQDAPELLLSLLWFYC